MAHDATYLHTELESESGKRIAVSYSRSTGSFTGEIRLVALELEMTSPVK